MASSYFRYMVQFLQMIFQISSALLEDILSQALWSMKHIILTMGKIYWSIRWKSSCLLEIFVIEELLEHLLLRDSNWKLFQERLKIAIDQIENWKLKFNCIERLYNSIKLIWKACAYVQEILQLYFRLLLRLFVRCFLGTS